MCAVLEFRNVFMFTIVCPDQLHYYLDWKSPIKINE
jgi:hypothetical protein